MTKALPLQAGQGLRPGLRPRLGNCVEDAPRSPTLWSEGLEAQLQLGRPVGLPAALRPLHGDQPLSPPWRGGGGGAGWARRPPRGPHGLSRAVGARPLTALSRRFSRSDELSGPSDGDTSLGCWGRAASQGVEACRGRTGGTTWLVESQPLPEPRSCLASSSCHPGGGRGRSGARTLTVWAGSRQRLRPLGSR